MTIQKPFLSPLRLSLLLIAIISALFFHPWTDKYGDSLISWDKLGYYLYLPTLYIYKDWHYFSFMFDYYPAYQPSTTWYQTLITPDLKHVITYPVGVSFFQLPFFLLGHFSASLFHYPTDGFSQPYVFWIYVSGMFYTIIGLNYTYKNLCKFFPVKKSAYAVIFLLLSTNLYYYGFIDDIMPHSYSFFLLSFLLYQTFRWHEQQSFRNSLLICLSVGFLVSIRTTDCVAIFIPLLYGVYNKATLIEKLKMLKSNAGKLMLALLIGMIPFYVQLFYWHFATGSWLFNAYSYTGLSFSWTKPHIEDFLTSFRKGWFIYTPVMLLAVAGFFWMGSSLLKKLRLGLIVFLLFNLYIFSAWNLWWFGGSYGQRSMVQSYALLAVPFTAAIQVFSKRNFTRQLLYVFIASCVAVNLLFSWAYKNSIILTDGMNFKMFKETLLHPFSSYIPEEKKEDKMQWKDEYLASKVLLLSDSVTRTMHIGEFSGIRDFTGEELLKSPYQWIRCTYETRFASSDKILPNNLHVVNEVKNPFGVMLFWKGRSFTDQFSEKDKMSEWKTRTVDFRIPHRLYENDKFMLYFWLTEKSTVEIRNVHVYGLVTK